MKAGFQTVFFKEMKDVLRDRKTLLLMIVLPVVVVPLLLKPVDRVRDEEGKGSPDRGA